MLPRKLQSRYRRHLFNLKLLFQITRARRSLNQLSRFRIHLVQEFDISRIQSRKNVCETNIVVLHDQTPQRISLPDHPAFLLRFSRRQSSLQSMTYVSRQNQLLFFFFFDLFCFVFRQRRKKCRFLGGISNVISHFRIVNCTTPKSLETTQITACLQRARATHKKSGHSLSRMEVRSIDLRTCRKLDNDSSQACESNVRIDFLGNNVSLYSFNC